MVVPMLVKVDQIGLSRPLECAQTVRWTDTNRFYNLSHAMLQSSMGQMKHRDREIGPIYM